MVYTIAEGKPLETDASYVSLAVTPNQEGRPVAFWFTTLNLSVRNYSPVNKEANAIID